MPAPHTHTSNSGATLAGNKRQVGRQALGESVLLLQPEADKAQTKPVSKVLPPYSPSSSPRGGWTSADGYLIGCALGG